MNSKNTLTQPNQAIKTVNEQAFKAAMSQFVTGITIVTTCDQHNNPMGLTVNSFNSVSLSPPLVLWSLNKQSKKLDTFMKADYFGISVLAADQEHLSRHFSQHHENAFENIEIMIESQGIPLISNALAYFICKTRNRYDEGDHLILIGEVQFCSSTEGQALAYRARKYHQI